MHVVVKAPLAAVWMSYSVSIPRTRFCCQGFSATPTCSPLAWSFAPAASCGSSHRSWLMVRFFPAVRISSSSLTCMRVNWIFGGFGLLLRQIWKSQFSLFAEMLGNISAFLFQNPLRPKLVHSHPLLCRLCRHLTEDIFPRWDEWVPDSVPAVWCTESIGIPTSDGLRSPVSGRQAMF